VIGLAALQASPLPLDPPLTVPRSGAIAVQVSRFSCSNGGLKRARFNEPWRALCSVSARLVWKASAAEAPLRQEPTDTARGPCLIVNGTAPGFSCRVSLTLARSTESS